MKTQVPCVSSVSQLDDEESASESSTELKVYTQLSSTNPQAFDRPLLAPSPAPVPIQGGEDEVIRVSAVRKIKVNSTEQVFKTKNIVEAPPPRKQEDQPIPPTSDSSIQLQTPDIADMPKRIITNPETDGDESHSDSEPMTVIEKSPYENNMDAEKGVELFTKMKNVLKERNEGDDYRTVHEEATKIFGPTNAWCLVKANSLIDKSGMVYSQEWCTGNIRGNQIGKIPKQLLLLCLVSKRFAKAQDQLLSGLTRDFGVSTIVQQAITGWRLSPTKYHKIVSTAKNYQFATRRRDCYKCAIFVARAYSCYKAFLMEGSLERTLKAKVIACLDLMEEHLPGPPSTKKPKKSIETETSSIDVPTEIPCNPADETKRKRGRPPKKSLVAKSSGDAASQNTLLDDEEDMVPYNPPARKKARKNSNVASRLVQNADLKDSEEEDDENDMVPYNPPVRGKGRKSMNGADNGKVKAAPSLSNLITKFEEQYHVMGEIYQQVGQTLHALKSKIQENRTTTEEEIRNELLQEVQDNLLKSFGKK